MGRGGRRRRAMRWALLAVLVVEAAVRRPFEKKIEAVLGWDGWGAEEYAAAGVVAGGDGGGEFRVGAAAERLRRKLRSHDVAGSVAIGKLAKLGEWRDSMDNMMVQGVNLPLMYSVQLAWAVQRWRRRHGGRGKAVDRGGRGDGGAAVAGGVCV